MPGAQASENRQTRDGRRRQWVPLVTDFPFDSLSVALQSKFGAGGLGLWASLLTAAKRAFVQGVIEYGSDDEFFRLVGIDPTDLGFTLDEFLKVTGDHKQTRRRHRGRIKQIVLTHWEDLNQWPRTGSARRGNPKSGGESTRQIRARSAPMTVTETETETPTHRNDDSLYIEEARRQVQKLRHEGSRITNPEGYAKKLVSDPEWRETVDSRVKAARAISECQVCDEKGHVYLLPDGTPTTSDNPRANEAVLCSHPEPA